MVLDAAAEKARIALLDAPPRPAFLTEIKTAAALGRRPIDITSDLLRVLRGPGRLTAHEYFYYRLYDPSIARDEKLRYVGKRAQQRFHDICNDPHWFAIAHDKALFYAVARGAGLPVPETVAVYAPGGRNFGAPALRTTEDLAAFLRDPTLYPLFIKPIDGMYSVGVQSLASIAGDQIRLATGETIELDEVLRFINEFGRDGFLLQRCLEPHPLLRQAYGGTLGTVRFLILLGSKAAAIESALLKIPTARNPADNYWRAGNMLGALDETGIVRRVIMGAGATTCEVTTHPDTGTALPGLQLPHWHSAMQLCLHAAAMFPGIRTQSWDIAIVESGPVLMEFNFGGDLNLHQLAHQRGALTPSYVAHLQSCGCRGLG